MSHTSKIRTTKKASRAGKEGRTRETLTISLPPAMAREIQNVRMAEHRTSSELIREALRVYFKSRDAVIPTAEEASAIRRGRDEIARGEYVHLHELDAARRKKR